MSTIERIQHEQSQLRTYLDRPAPGNLTLEHVPTLPVGRCAKVALTAEDIQPAVEWSSEWLRLVSRLDDYNPTAADKAFNSQKATLAKDPKADPRDFKSREEIAGQYAAISEALFDAQQELLKQAPARCEALIRKISKGLAARVAEVEKNERKLSEELGLPFEESRILKRCRATATRFDENAAKPNGLNPRDLFASLVDFEKGAPCK